MTLQEKLDQPGTQNLRAALQDLIEAEELVTSLPNDASAIEIEAWSASIGWRKLVEQAGQNELDRESSLLVAAISCKVHAMERFQIGQALYESHDDPGLLKNLPASVRRFYVEAVAKGEEGLRTLEELEERDADLVDGATKGLLHWYAARASVPLLDFSRASYHYCGVLAHLPGSQKATFAHTFLDGLAGHLDADAGPIPELSLHSTTQVADPGKKHERLAGLVKELQQELRNSDSDPEVVELILMEIETLSEPHKASSRNLEPTTSVEGKQPVASRQTIEEIAAQPNNENLRIALALLVEADSLVDSLRGTSSGEIEARSIQLGWYGKNIAAQEVDLDYKQKSAVRARSSCVRAKQQLLVASAWLETEGPIAENLLLKPLSKGRDFLKQAYNECETALAILSEPYSILDTESQERAHSIAATVSQKLGDRQRAAHHYAALAEISPGSNSALHAKTRLAELGVNPNAPPMQTRPVSGASPAVKQGAADTQYLIAWICTVLGFCFLPSMFVGLYFAHLAVKQGREDAKVPRTIALVISGLAVLAFIFFAFSSFLGFLARLFRG